MDIAKASSRYSVRLLTENDIPAVYALCRKNTLFYQHCPPFVSEENILGDMNALPPHTQRNDKYYTGYFREDRLTAVLDLISGYPDPRTAFISFFMTDVSIQNNGIGSQIISDLCAFLKEAGFSRVRLGYVSTNPQAAHFWHKNGFADTGQVYVQERYTVTAAERLL